MFQLKIFMLLSSQVTPFMHLERYTSSRQGETLSWRNISAYYDFYFSGPEGVLIIGLGGGKRAFSDEIRGSLQSNGPIK